MKANRREFLKGLAATAGLVALYPATGDFFESPDIIVGWGYVLVSLNGQMLSERRVAIVDSGIGYRAVIEPAINVPRNGILTAHYTTPLGK